MAYGRKNSRARKGRGNYSRGYTRRGGRSGYRSRAGASRSAGRDIRIVIEQSPPATNLGVIANPAQQMAEKSKRHF